RRRLEYRDGQPHHADDRATHHETGDALVCAPEHIQEFPTQFKIFFGGKKGAGSGAACYWELGTRLAGNLPQGVEGKSWAKIRLRRQRLLQHGWSLQQWLRLKTIK